MIVVNKNGYELDFDAALMYMNDDIVEKLNIVMPYDCSEQGFFYSLRIRIRKSNR